MLVLSRRLGEVVTLGSDFRIVELCIKGGQVRLGIEAPPQVEVHRDEVHARIQEENRMAAGPGVIPLEAFRQLSNKTGRRGA